MTYRSRASIPEMHELPQWPAHVHHFVRRDPRCARCLKAYHAVLCCHRTFTFWGHHYDEGYCHRTCYDCYNALLRVIHELRPLEIEAGNLHAPMTTEWWLYIWYRLSLESQEALRLTFPPIAILV